MDSNAPSADKYEIGIITKDDNGNVVQRRVEGAELEAILNEANVFEQNQGN